MEKEIKITFSKEVVDEAFDCMKSGIELTNQMLSDKGLPANYTFGIHEAKTAAWCFEKDATKQCKDLLEAAVKEAYQRGWDESAAYMASAYTSTIKE